MIWQDSFNIGVEKIDNQHKMLCSIADQLKKSFSTDTTAVELGSTLKFLDAYTQFHFSSEEQLMKAIEYPHFSEQLDFHDSFRATIAHYLKKIKGGSDLNIYEVLDFIVDWISSHIIGEDKKIGEFIRAKIRSSKKTEYQVTAPRNNESDVLISMQRLKELYKKGLFSKEDFQKNEVIHLNEYITLSRTEKIDDVEILLNMLDFLRDEQLLDSEAHENYKTILFEKLDLNYELSQCISTEEKEEHLYQLFKQGLITDDEVKKYLGKSVVQ